jgi:hypothetical protein
MIDDVEGALWTNAMFDDRVGWEIEPDPGNFRMGAIK